MSRPPSGAAATASQPPAFAPMPAAWRGPAPLIALLLIVAVCAAYWALPTHSYVNYDDNLHVYQNIRLNPATPANVAYFWTHAFIRGPQDGMKPYEQLYAPVTFTTYAALVGIARLPQKVSELGSGAWDLDPHVYHAAGLVLHVLNTLLIFLLLRRLVRKDWAAAAGAAFFGLHPVQVEPVAWVSAMNNELVGLFGFLSLLLYLSYAEASGDAPPSARRHWFYALALACFVLALLSKPSAVVFVFMAAILDAMAVRRPLRDIARSLWPWAVLTIACVVLNQSLQPTTARVDPNIAVPITFRPIIAGDALAFYLGKLVWPFGLGVDYGRFPRHVHESGAWPYLTSLVPVALAALLLLLRRRAPMLLISGMLFLAALLPVIGLVTYYFQATSTVADRYLYLPLFGPALAVAWLLSRTPARAVYPVAGLCVALLALLGARTADQGRYWRNSEALYRRAIQINPTSYTAHDNLGIMLAEQHRLADAIPTLRRTVELAPADPGAREDLAHVLCDDGLAKGQGGKLAESIADLEEAERVKPDYEPAHEYMAVALSMQGDWNAAAAQLREAVRLKPDNPEGHYKLGVVLTRLGKTPDAVAEYQEALRLRPEYPEASAALRTVRR